MLQQGDDEGCTCHLYCTCCTSKELLDGHPPKDSPESLAGGHEIGHVKPVSCIVNGHYVAIIEATLPRVEVAEDSVEPQGIHTAHGELLSLQVPCICGQAKECK